LQQSFIAAALFTDGRREDKPEGEEVMAWLARNWFWVLIGIAFIGMHVFGHGGHSGHGGGDHQQRRDGTDKDAAQGRAVNTGSGGHQH